jgi:hypothetical protein
LDGAVEAPVDADSLGRAEEEWEARSVVEQPPTTTASTRAAQIVLTSTLTVSRSR